MVEAVGLIDAIYTTRSVRRYLDQPIPDEVVTKLIEAATRAPNGSNAQSWRFVVVRDPEQRRQVGEVYRQAYAEYHPPEEAAAEQDPERIRARKRGQRFAETMGTEAPLLVVFCLENSTSGAPVKHPGSVAPRSRGSSVYPAVQNMLLAARAYGIGGCLTTIHLLREAQLKQVLGLPDNVDTFALVPLGYPATKFGPVRRLPVAAVTFAERWGAPFEAMGTSKQ